MSQDSCILPVSSSPADELDKLCKQCEKYTKCKMDFNSFIKEIKESEINKSVVKTIPNNIIDITSDKGTIYFIIGELGIIEENHSIIITGDVLDINNLDEVSDLVMLTSKGFCENQDLVKIIYKIMKKEYEIQESLKNKIATLQH